MSSGASRGASKGGSKNKPNKSDSKPDKVDLNPKIQPTAEQMQIARIIDTHRSEDPELQKKIRQVMEITRSTEDEASMALHSREYDIEQAITLLTEGGSQSLESEWAQAGKKRKPKTPSQKADLAREKDRGAGKESGDRGGRERSEKRERDSRTERIDRERKDSEAGDGQNFSGEQRRGGDRGGRSGPRRGGRGGMGRGGRIDNNKENDEVNGTRGSYGGSGYGRMANGPGRGGRGSTGGRGGRGGRENSGRTFANRARGRDGDSSYNTIDVWENSQADAPAEAAPLKVDNWDEFPSAEDWDNEEYTGSLADTKVFTPSSQPQGAPPLSDTTNGVGGPTTNHIVSATSAGTAPGDVKISSGNQEPAGAGPGVNLSSVVSGLNTASGGSNVVSGQSIDLNMLLQKPQSATDNSETLVRNAGANLLATLQSSYSNTNQVQVGPPGNQSLPARHKVQRPRGPVSKIPSSAVEMPDDAVTTLDVQFGGLDFGTDTSMSFNPVMHGGKPGGELLYGGPPPKMDTFSAAGDKEVVQNKVAPPPAQSPFQSQRNTGASLVEPSKGPTGGVPITPSIDTHSMSLQNQKSQTQQPSYANVNASNAGSAFVSYGNKGGAPGFPAPGFPPVTQTATGSVTYNSNAGGTGSVTGTSTYGTQNSLQSQQQASSYHNMSNLSYNSQQTVVSTPQVSQVQPQPVIPSVTQNQNASTAYGSSSVPNQNAYHHANANTNSGYVNSSSGANQYGGYTPKMSSSLAATGSGGHASAKDLVNDGTSNVAVATTSSVSSAQLGTNMQTGSVITAASSTSNTKLATTANTTNNTTGSKMGTAGLPPGMVMQPQYILGQGSVPTFYSVQTPFYGFDENAVQILPRLPPHMAGYYDANAAAANYGAGTQGGVTARNDGAALPTAYSTGADGRYARSDSSTASPVPSNLAGGNTQAMYTQGLPGYYYLGNNVVHGAPFPYAPPPHMYPTTAMATATNASGAQHAAATNHQYPSKNVYGTPYAYDGQGPTTDFSKNSYTGSTGVGPNSNAGKGSSGTTAGTSQSTDLNTSMYAKGHNMNKMNSYDNKGYGATTSGGYNNSMGAQTNALNSQLGGTGMGAPYGVYIAQPPVQSLAIHQDGSNASRQGTGQPKGNKQQYGAPYWSN